MTELEKFRYDFEQRLLPQLLYNEKAKLLNAILDKEGKFFSDLFIVFGPVTDTIYNEKEFVIGAKRIQSDDKMLDYLIVNMPKPTMMPLCRRIYLCFEEKSGIVRYYTSEKSIDNKYAMCCVTKQGTRLNYGSAPDDGELEFRKIGNIFLKYILENDKE